MFSHVGKFDGNMCGTCSGHFGSKTLSSHHVRNMCVSTMPGQFGATGGNAKLRWGRGWGVVGRVVGSLFFLLTFRFVFASCAEHVREHTGNFVGKIG